MEKMQENNWIVLSSTPPTSQDTFDQTVAALRQANIPIEIEENQARQCENDVAFWLRVQINDLPLAWNIAQGLEPK